MSDLSEMEIFVAVVDSGTYTEAGRRLGVSKSHVSKKVSALEDRLGVQLLNRTTRTVSLNDVGRAFYERSALIIEQLKEAERSVTEMHTTPQGTLKISAPSSFGRRFVAPVIVDFLAEFPDISVDLDLADRKVDLIDEGYDLAIRIGELQDSSLMVRKLAGAERYCCASPEYLEAHGTPKHPADLADHQCLEYSYGRLNTWQFVGPDQQEHYVQVQGRLRANNGEVLVEAGLAGLGISLIPDFMIGDHLQSGRLVRILDEWTEWNAGVWALYPHNRHLSAKVRKFIDHLVREFSPKPWRV
jgi:DNA-binding transcriptional LysR family regulator